MSARNREICVGIWGNQKKNRGNAGHADSVFYIPWLIPKVYEARQCVHNLKILINNSQFYGFKAYLEAIARVYMLVMLGVLGAYLVFCKEV